MRTVNKSLMVGGAVGLVSGVTLEMLSESDISQIAAPLLVVSCLLAIDAFCHISNEDARSPIYRLALFSLVFGFSLGLIVTKPYGRYSEDSEDTSSWAPSFTPNFFPGWFNGDSGDETIGSSSSIASSSDLKP